MKTKLMTLIFFIFHTVAYSQTPTPEEKKLYDIIMLYRKDFGLSNIPLSRALTTVAQTHVRDLSENKPDLGIGNAHSWSGNGNWTACSYTEDHAQAQCMWSKPREITSYTGDGFEIACGSNKCCSTFIMTPEYALSSWKSSKPHNAVILNQGIWSDNTWNAIGVGLYKGFAVVWFGKVYDKN